jgi:glutamine synthetase type III
MSDLRQFVDELETFIAKKHWPIPAYAEILYSVI